MKLSALVGSRVYDARGERIGRVIDATAQLQFIDGRAEYTCDALLVSHFGAFDALAGWRIMQQLFEQLAPYRGYHTFALDPRIVEFTGGRIRIRAGAG